MINTSFNDTESHDLDWLENQLPAMNHAEALACIEQNFEQIGHGAHRRVFNLDQDKVIKIDTPDHVKQVAEFRFKALKNVYPKAFDRSYTETEMEADKFIKSRSEPISKFLPELVSYLELADGNKVAIWECIRDAGGEISRSIDRYFDQKEYLGDLVSSLKDFEKALLASREKFHVYTPTNLVFQKLHERQSRVVMVDFGSWQDLTLIPLAAMFDSFYNLKVTRRLRKRLFRKLGAGS